MISLRTHKSEMPVHFCHLIFQLQVVCVLLEGLKLVKDKLFQLTTCFAATYSWRHYITKLVLKSLLLATFAKKIFKFAALARLERHTITTNWTFIIMFFHRWRSRRRKYPPAGCFYKLRSTLLTWYMVRFIAGYSKFVNNFFIFSFVTEKKERQFNAPGCFTSRVFISFLCYAYKEACRVMTVLVYSQRPTQTFVSISQKCQSQQY